MSAWIDEMPQETPKTSRPDLSAVPPLPDTAKVEGPGRVARRGAGLALLGLTSASRFMAGHPEPLSSTAQELPARPSLDVALGLVDVGLEVAETLSDTVSAILGPLIARTVDPALAPARGMSRTTVAALGAMTRPLARRGSRLRAEAEAEAIATVSAVLPASMEIVLDQVDLTDQAIDRVDIERVMTAAFNDVDMEGLMIDNVDLSRIVLASLSQVDLTEVALNELDLERVVMATLDQVDILSIARDQVDPVRVAAYLRDNVDLAEVLRTAPSDAVRGVFDTVGKMVPGRSQPLS
ncbi:MAG: hypothetical protein K0U64_01925 [Actinomycetia bacterium]|nr:hypothetical protein [Actinomycetes bacterium]